MSSVELPKRKITIAHSNLDELQKDAWSTTFVPVTLSTEGKSYGAKIAYRGGHTRDYAKKSYEIHLDEGLVLHWNAEYDDPSLIRNALSFHFFNCIGVHAPRTRAVLLELNGESHGVYIEIEAVNRRFFAKRSLKCRSLLYAVNDSAGFGLYDSDTSKRKVALDEGYETVLGGERARKKLSSFLKNINSLRGPKLAAYLSRNLDTQFYLRWLAGAVLTGNYDGFEQNYALYEDSNTGKYRILPWDYEGTWGRNCFGKPVSSDLVDVRGYNTLTEKLLSFPRWRKQYFALLRKLVNTEFTVEKLSPVIDRLSGQLTSAVRLDYTRSHSYQAFLDEPDLIRNYIKERRSGVLQELGKWESELAKKKTSAKAI